jgi:hypothetical protein
MRDVPSAGPRREAPAESIQSEQAFTALSNTRRYARCQHPKLRIKHSDPSALPRSASFRAARISGTRCLLTPPRSPSNRDPSTPWSTTEGFSPPEARRLFVATDVINYRDRTNRPQPGLRVQPPSLPTRNHGWSFAVMPVIIRLGGHPAHQCEVDFKRINVT